MTSQSVGDDGRWPGVTQPWTLASTWPSKHDSLYNHDDRVGWKKPWRENWTNCIDVYFQGFEKRNMKCQKKKEFSFFGTKERAVFVVVVVVYLSVPQTDRKISMLEKEIHKRNWQSHEKPQSEHAFIFFWNLSLRNVRFKWCSPGILKHHFKKKSEHLRGRWGQRGMNVTTTASSISTRFCLKSLVLLSRITTATSPRKFSSDLDQWRLRQKRPSGKKYCLSALIVCVRD